MLECEIVCIPLFPFSLAQTHTATCSLSHTRAHVPHKGLRGAAGSRATLQVDPVGRRSLGLCYRSPLARLSRNHYRTGRGCCPRLCRLPSTVAHVPPLSACLAASSSVAAAAVYFAITVTQQAQTLTDQPPFTGSLSIHPLLRTRPRTRAHTATCAIKDSWLLSPLWEGSDSVGARCCCRCRGCCRCCG